MALKLFIHDNDTITITCPECKKTKNMPVSRFKGRTRAKIKCTCGNTIPIQLEKRRYYRKETDLSGKYRVIQTRNNPPDSGTMTVADISKNGVRLRFSAFPFIEIGDILNIQFNLDDKNRSFVDRNVVIQNIDAPYAGAKFHRPHELDNVIGFYLFR